AIHASPISRASPVIILSTPAGIPALWASSISLYAVNGVNSDGFTTTVQPAAMAGPTLRVIIAAGKFHGVIAATTPTGCFNTRIRLFGEEAGTVCPYTRLASSANQERKLLAYITSPIASCSG